MYETRQKNGQSNITFRSNKFSTDEWRENNSQIYFQSNVDRDLSEKQRWKATRTENETVAWTHKAQADSTKKLQQRLHDIRFWKFELNRMIEDVRNETELLVQSKKRLTNALDATAAPMAIARECVANRERRYGADRVEDPVDEALSKEIQILNDVENLLQRTILSVEEQIRSNRNAKEKLEIDWSNKLEAEEADRRAANRRNEDVDIMFYPGVARNYENQSTVEVWAQNSHDNIVNAENQLVNSVQIRKLVENILNDTTRDLREQADVVETEFARRIAQVSDAMQKMIFQLRETLKEIGENEKKLDSIRASIRGKEAPLKVAQTRLNDRRARPGIEMCRDAAQESLIKEVQQISEIVDALQNELFQTEEYLKKLRDDQQILVKEIENKKNSLEIDQKKSMEIRARFPTVERLRGYNS